MFLQRLPDHFRLYAAILSGPPTDHVGIIKRRKAFVELVRKGWGGAVKFTAVSEVGPISGKWHDHCLLVSEGVEVSPADVLSLWRKACGEHPDAEVHDHRPPDDIQDACRYTFKSDGKFHDPANRKCVRLLAKGSPNITWGSRFFPEKERKRLWRERYPISDPAGDADREGTRERLGSPGEGNAFPSITRRG